MHKNRTALVVASFVLLCSALEGSGEGEQPAKTHLYNWDYKDFSSQTFGELAFSPRHPIGIIDAKNCPDGWLRFSESCYFVEEVMMGFARAEQRCAEKNATLFVANSIDEWDAIRQHVPKSFFTWIGLVRFSQYEKTETLPRWQTEGGVSPASLNWLVRPYNPITEGWTTLSNCAATFNPAVVLEALSFVFYYPCTLSMYSICERNATFIELLKQNQAI